VAGRHRAVLTLVLVVANAERARSGERRGDEQRLRDRGVPDLVGASDGTEPDQIAARQLGPRLDAFGDAWKFQPRFEEARSLSTLSWRCDDKHPSTLHCRSPPYE